MRVLVTGASGFVGRHVADALRAAGHELRCLVRPSSAAAHLRDAGDDLHQGHLLDPSALEAAARDVEAVVHVAGLVRARTVREMVRVNAEGTARLAGACRRVAAPGARFVLVSSQAAAGPSAPGRVALEEEVPRPVSAYGRSKLAGERAAARVLGDAAPPTIVRPPAVYGPHDRDIFDFFQAAARGVSLRVGCRMRAVSLVHVEDLARGILGALESPAAAGRTYYLANRESHAMDELMARINAAVGGRSVSIRVPEAVLHGAAVAVDEVARFLGIVPKLSVDKARELLASGWACDSSRAARELGWEARIPLDEGLRSTAVWYRSNGWL